MKPFLTKILLFSGLLLLFFGVIEFLLRSIPNDYSYKASYYKENADKIKIWNLGSSHAYFGIDPTYLGENSFNGAHVSQSIKFDYYIFDKYIDKMDSLEVLILPISYFTLFSNLEAGIEKWRVVNYSAYNIYLPNLRTSLHLLSDNKPFNKAVKGFLDMQNDRYCTDLGFGTQYSYNSRSHNLVATADAAVKRHTKDEINIDILNENKFFLESICNKCNERNIKVIILTTPTHHSYYNQLNKNQLDITTNICSSLCNKYPNVTYLNWLTDRHFIDGDYYDADHLNNRGAEKMTLLLSDTINKFF